MPQLLGDETTHLLNGGAAHDGILSSERPPRHSVVKIIKDILLSSVVNVFLVFVPIGIVAGALGWNATTVFALNFCAIIPLAALLSLATEDLASRVGQTLGGLMNATFGNAVELIVSVIALKNGEIQIVQSSMLGSILSNTLLVLGCCFLIGGLRYPTQSFNQTVAQTMSSLLGVATSSLLIPAAFHSTVPNSRRNDSLLLDLSRGTAIIILILYVLYLIFSLKTHHAIFDAVAEEEDQVAPEVEITVIGSFILLFVVTILISICADYMVSSIDALVLSTGLSKTFIGLILIPIVGNAAEHVTAVMVAWKNKMDLAAGVAIGSSIQIALFLTPFLVIVGWIMGQPMTLFFSTFETVIMFISVFMVGYVVQDGESNWLEGSMLLGVYFIICIAFFYFPAEEVVFGPIPPIIPSN